MSRALMTVALAAALCLRAGAARASDDLAWQYLAASKEHLAAARFTRALAEAESAEGEARSPPLIAEVSRHKGIILAVLRRIGPAIVSFARSLRLAPEERVDADEAGDNAAALYRCAEQLVGAQLGDVEIDRLVSTPAVDGALQPFRCPVPPQAATLPATSIAPTAPAPAETPADSTLRIVGLGAGAAAVVAGAVLGAVAFTTRRELDREKERGEPRDVVGATQDRGRSFAIAADVLVLSGLVIGTVALLID